MAAWASPATGLSYGGGLSADWSPTEPGFQGSATMAGGLGLDGEVWALTAPFRLGLMLNLGFTLPRETVATSLRGAGGVAIGGQWGRTTYQTLHLAVGGHAYGAVARQAQGMYGSFGPLVRLEYSFGFPTGPRSSLEIGPCAAVNIPSTRLRGDEWTGNYVGHLGLDFTFLVRPKPKPKRAPVSAPATGRKPVASPGGQPVKSPALPERDRDRIEEVNPRAPLRGGRRAPTKKPGSVKPGPGDRLKDGRPTKRKPDAGRPGKTPARDIDVPLRPRAPGGGGVEEDDTPKKGPPSRRGGRRDGTKGKKGKKGKKGRKNKKKAKERKARKEKGERAKRKKRAKQRERRGADGG